jgi:hypothetical protein
MRAIRDISSKFHRRERGQGVSEPVLRIDELIVAHPPPPLAAFPANGLPPDFEGEDPSIRRDEDTEVTRLFREQISNGTLLRIETCVG